MAERVQARDHERLSRAVWPRRTEALALVLRALEPLPRAQARAAARAVAELQRAAAEQLERRREESTRALERVLAAPDTDRLLERLLESAPALHSCALYSW